MNFGREQYFWKLTEEEVPAIFLRIGILYEAAFRVKLLRFLVLAGCDSWSGELSQNEMKALASDAGMDHAAYMQDTLKALTGDNKTDFKVECCITKNKKAELKWKSISSKETLVFQLGSLKLENGVAASEEAGGLLSDTLDWMVTRMAALEEKRDAAVAERDVALLGREEAVQNLSDCITSREESETLLITQFSRLLNEKKIKIRELVEGKIDGLDAKPSTSSAVPHHPDTEPVSGSEMGEEEEELATDDEDAHLEQLKSQLSRGPSDGSNRSGDTDILPAEEPREEKADIFIPKRKKPKGKDTGKHPSASTTPAQLKKATRTSGGASGRRNTKQGSSGGKDSDWFENIV